MAGRWAFTPVAAQGGGGGLSISGFSGTLTDGSAYTINGSFTADANAVPAIFDNFETGTVDTQLNASPMIGDWTLQIDANPSHLASYYRTTQKHSGSQSCHCLHDDSANWGNFVHEIATGKWENIYYEFWFRPDNVGGQCKISQVHGSYYRDNGISDFAPQVYSGSSSYSWWFSGVVSESGSQDQTTWTGSVTPTAGAWNHIAVTGRPSSGGATADGYVEVKLNGSTVYLQDGIITRDSASEGWCEIGFGHGWTNRGTGNDANLYLDEVFAVTDTCSHVVFHNNSTEATSTERSIQTPTSWGSGSIALTVRQGNITTLSGSYCTVYDTDGNSVTAQLP